MYIFSFRLIIITRGEEKEKEEEEVLLGNCEEHQHKYEQADTCTSIGEEDATLEIVTIVQNQSR